MEASLAEAHARLDADPVAAEALARDLLATHPGHPGARFLQAFKPMIEDPVTMLA